uniref:Zinc finger MYM-type protein 1 n=1 Tax=Triticum urartu TaxID=4572 RepID=A0A8R7VAZ0_TRIUA
MIQKDIAECFAKQILHSILEEIGDGVFSLLVDESRDVAGKEQMVVVLRYAGKCGSAKESLVGLVHVKETTSKYLKSAIDDLFAELSLSLKQVRGQGYDGASNMRGEFNGLQSLIMRENNTAYYVHCFAHQLQLVVVAVVRKHKWIGNFFDMISVLLNVVSGSSKRKDMIRDKYKEQVRGALGCGLLQSGTGLNQELALQRPDCVQSTKDTLNDLRRNGWESVLGEAYAFGDKHEISKLEMEEQYVNPKKPRQKTGITNKHHYEMDCFNDVIDWLLQELDNRFNEKNSKLLICLAALSPKESFKDFNLEHLMDIARLYPKDFDDGELRDLTHHLRLYIADVRVDGRFSGINNICELSQKMVETKKHIVYPLVYRLVNLALVLPVATATVERCFSGMKIVKTFLRNRLGDDALNHNLICYVEKEEMRKVTNDAVIDHFEVMNERRG